MVVRKWSDALLEAYRLGLHYPSHGARGGVEVWWCGGVVTLVPYGVVATYKDKQRKGWEHVLFHAADGVTLVCASHNKMLRQVEWRLVPSHGYESRGPGPVLTLAPLKAQEPERSLVERIGGVNSYSHWPPSGI